MFMQDEHVLVYVNPSSCLMSAFGCFWLAHFRRMESVFGVDHRGPFGCWGRDEWPRGVHVPAEWIHVNFYLPRGQQGSVTAGIDHCKVRTHVHVSHSTVFAEECSREVQAPTDASLHATAWGLGFLCSPYQQYLTSLRTFDAIPLHCLATSSQMVCSVLQCGAGCSQGSGLAFLPPQKRPKVCLFGGRTEALRLSHIAVQ